MTANHDTYSSFIEVFKSVSACHKPSSFPVLPVSQAKLRLVINE